MLKYRTVLIINFILTHPAPQTDYTFSSQSGAYTSLINPISAILVPAHVGTRTTLDESFANNISLGFAFQYNGINYSNIHLNANGFASLGAVFLASTATNPNYDVNELRGAAGFKGAIRPILAPFWDNLLLGKERPLGLITDYWRRVEVREAKHFVLIVVCLYFLCLMIFFFLFHFGQKLNQLLMRLPICL